MVYPIGKRIFVFLVRIWIKKVNGLENIPKDGYFIIAANHGSYFDDLAIAPIIIKHINKRVHMYCNDYFFGLPLIGRFLRWSKCIPVRVSEKKNKELRKINKKAFDDALKFLKKGEPVGIFPEGHRSYKGGRLRKAKTGIAKLALKSKVPVLPIGIKGSWNVLPVGSVFPRLNRCTINIGKPMHFNHCHGKSGDMEVLRKIMKKIAELCGRKYKY